MATIGKYLKKYKELLLYGVFGVLTTAVNFVVCFVLIHAFGTEQILWHNSVAWFVSVLFAFVTNKLWVFESRETELRVWLREGIPFFGARLFSLLLENGFLYLTIRLLALSYFWMKLISSVIVVIVNYLLSKILIFRQPGTPLSSGSNSPQSGAQAVRKRR